MSTTIGTIEVEASAEVVTAAEVARQHAAGQHDNCGHDQGVTE